jgi:hypothetical protein
MWNGKCGYFIKSGKFKNLSIQSAIHIISNLTTISRQEFNPRRKNATRTDVINEKKNSKSVQQFQKFQISNERKRKKHIKNTTSISFNLLNAKCMYLKEMEEKKNLNKKIK